jgi:hypothetical protein
MSKGALEGWLVALGIALAVCALGWYSAAAKNPVNTSSSYSSKESSSDSASTDEYASALQEANDNIESANSCIDDSFDLFDNGDFDDGMSALEDCKRDTVSEPY